MIYTAKLLAELFPIHHGTFFGVMSSTCYQEPNVWTGFGYKIIVWGFYSHIKITITGLITEARTQAILQLQ